MRDTFRAVAAELTAPLITLSIFGVVGLLVYRQIFGGTTASDVVRAAIDGANDIRTGLPSLIGSAWRGESERNYISQDEAKANDAAALAAARAAKGLI